MSHPEDPGRLDLQRLRRSSARCLLESWSVDAEPGKPRTQRSASPQQQLVLLTSRSLQCSFNAGDKVQREILPQAIKRCKCLVSKLFRQFSRSYTQTQF